MFISKPGFEQQKKVFPLFLRNGWTNWTENFSTNTRCKSGCVFFFFPRNLVSVKFGRPYKIFGIKKTLVFDKVFSILLLLTCENDIFQRGKKHAPRFAFSICRKIFSSIGWTPEFCVGENFRSFLALVTPKTPWREHLRILVLWQTFLYSSRSIYPESFMSFRPAVSEKHRKGGGGPLKQDILCINV